MNKNESMMLALGGIILVAALAVVGYVFWLKNKASLEEPANQAASISQLVLPQTQATSTVTTETTTATSSASVAAARATTTASANPEITTPAAIAATSEIVPGPDWQAYRESEYGVAGTFPDPWYEYDAVGLGGSLQFTSVLESDATIGGMINQGDAEITIYRTPETVTQARAEDSLNGTQEGITTATVAGESVSVVAYDVASSENTLVAYIPNGSYLYRVILAYHGETQFANVFSQFLATFRFEN